MVPTLALSALLAGLSWLGLWAEGVISLQRSLAAGLGVAEAAFLFFRFFTNLTVLGVALLMTTTAWRSWRRRPLPAPGLHAAVLVYVLVVSVTYEALLRHLWSPHGIWFVRDALMHDVVPALTLVFWVFCAPKAPLAWSDPLRWLAYPLSYIAATLIAGALGQGYPYAFLDLHELGYAGLLRNAAAFAVAFYGLGLLIVAVASGLTLRLERKRVPGPSRSAKP